MYQMNRLTHGQEKKDSHMVELNVIVYMYFKDHKERTVYWL